MLIIFSHTVGDKTMNPPICRQNSLGTPYLEIYKDSNMTYDYCKSPTGKTYTLNEWLWNPQIQIVGDAAEYEYPASNLGTMEQFHSGQRKTYTIMPENDRWYSFGTQNNTPNLMPLRGGNQDYHKPS